ncbi:amino acid adenylation domain-containing protein [Agrobacterium sp. a22-2]|uniref:amino acid adenylation domain-containing protein n=1 Tax=Agrobacterium sp. a22-2 TaxID=2283840 RepID=UPI0034CD4DB7
MNAADPILALRARVAALGPAERETFRRQLEARGIAWERVAPEEESVVTRPARLPLTPGQMHFWIQQSLYPESSAYHVAYRWRFEGPLDRVALERSLAMIVARHAPLRTAFPVEAGKPWQEVHMDGAFTMGFTDLEATGEDGEALALTVATEPFDLSQAPLIRAHLFRQHESEHLLAITLHHIVADGWSRGVLMRELTACYRAYRMGETPALTEIVRDFGDLVLDQQAWLRSPDCGRARDYWKQTLTGLKPLELPSDRSRSSSIDMTAAAATRVIPVSVSSQIASLASRLGTTPFVVMAAAFKLLLHRYSGERDLSVCVPVAGRSDPGAAGLIGLFTNTLVLRAELDPRMTFPQWVATVQERFSDALDHQAFPFPMIAETLGMSRDQRQNPLSQIMFQLQSESYRAQNAERIDFGIDDLHVRQQPARLRETKVDLSWYVMERESGYLLNIEYRAAIFDAWRIERMAAHFEVLLRSILRQPYALLPTLAYLSKEERAAIVALGTPAAQPLPDITVHDAIADIALRQPDAIALESQGRSWTYSTLLEDVNALAATLVGLSVRPGDRVAVSLPGRGQSVVAFLAILKAGAVYVPLDPDHPAERVAYVLNDSGVGLVLTDRADLYPAQRSLDPTLPLPENDGAVALPPSDPARIAYLLYTSGSTGRPNGVPIGHASLLNHLRSMAVSPGLAPGDRLLAITTPTFDISILEMLLPLSVGATTVLYGQDLLLSPQRLSGVLIEDRISHLQATPAYWRMLIDSGWEGLPHLTVLCGGEALDAPLARKLIDRTKELWNVYGPTEATIWASALKVTPAHAESGKVPVGGLLDNTHLHVLDTYMEPLPRGIPGELYIGGPCLSSGYWNRPALAAARFVPNPFYDERSPTLRLYRTGDAVVRQTDGEIEFIGRTDFQVKLRGYRIEIGEIEDKLLRESVVKHAIVTLDAENERLIAYVLTRDVPSANDGATEHRLRQSLSAQLPRYMVPTAFVLLTEFPLSPNGKVDRRRLPVPQVSATRAAPVSARNASEATLLTIWKAVLRREDIGVEDNFFDLGGDSIIGVQIVAKAQAKGLKLEPTQIFELQTVAAQASAASLAVESEVSTVEVADVAPSFEMTPLQAGMLFHSLMAPTSGTYFEQCWCVLEGPLDVDAFKAAWKKVVARHEVLRGSCRWVDLERPVMVIADAVVPEWHEADWSAEDPAGQEKAFAAWLEADRRRGFVLDAAPLLRFALIRLGHDRHRFVWSFHHLLMDGWCGSLLVGEMLKAYTGEDLPVPPSSYRQYVAWRDRQDAAAAQAYWTQALADLPQSDLFSETRAVEAGRDAFVEIRCSLETSISTRLASMARRERLTLATVLQGAWALLLSRYGSEDDVIFGTILSGRPPDLPDADRMIGLFLNTVPFRARTRPDETVADWLQGLQAEHRQREKHGHAALADIQRWAGTTADRPLFETLLIIENLPLSMRSAFSNGTRALTLNDPGSYERTHYPLSLRIFPGAEIEIALAADPSRISSIAAARLLRHFEALLSSIADNPGACLGAIEMLDPAERESLLQTGLGQQRQPSPVVHDQIVARANREPDKAAVVRVGEGSDSVTSYGDLVSQADALALRLRDHGIGRGAIVAVYMGRGGALMPSLLAVMRTGAAYLPIDPDYPADRIAFMLADSGAALVLTDLDDGERGAVPGDIPVVDPTQSVDVARKSFEPAMVHDDDLAYILYTSGSTGRPKGVAITHGALANFIVSMAEKPGIGASDRLLALTTIGFDIAGLELFAPLAGGGTVLLADSKIVRDGRRLAALVDRVRPTVMQATPAGWRMLIEAEWQGDKTLRMLCGGEALDNRLAIDLLDRGGSLWNLYGPTETTIWSAAAEVKRDHLDGSGVPVAGAIDRTQLYVLDRRGEPVPRGTPGELHIGGAGVSPGYWGKPGLTAERFVPNPFRRTKADGHHLYRTGDLVRLREDGAFDFLGRIDNQVKLRGYRIELGEVEARLATHPNVAEAAVLVEDRGAGKQLVAYLRWRRPGVGGTTAELGAHMAETLPAYMLPSVYVSLDAFPLTPNGKVDRRALPAHRPQPAASQTIVPISGEPAATLAAIWREALKVDHVGPGDNFFERGGHSLLVVSLQGVVSKRFGVSLDITDFFRFPTLESMAAHLAALQGGYEAERPEIDRTVSRLAGRDRLAGRRGPRAERTMA